MCAGVAAVELARGHDQCDNTITSLMEYTGTGGSAEHFKDFPDCIRYLVTSGAEYVTHNMLQTTGGGGY